MTGFIRSVGRVVWAWLGWLAQHWRVTLLATGAGVVGYARDRSIVTVAAGLVLGGLSIGSVVWARAWPLSFERWVAGPHRRWGWRRWARRSWSMLARECGLSVQRKRRRNSLVVGSQPERQRPGLDRHRGPGLGAPKTRQDPNQ